MDHQCAVSEVVEQPHVLAMLGGYLGLRHVRELLLPQPLEGLAGDQPALEDSVSFVVDRGVALPLVELVDFADVPLKGSSVVVGEGSEEGVEDLAEGSLLFF